jgi:hypothetical protein
MIDVDCVEHDGQGNPLALIETKYGYLDEIDLNSLQFNVLCKLAGSIPVLCLVYYPMDANDNLVDAGQEDRMTHIQFIAMGVNQAGSMLIPEPKQLTELRWVELIADLHEHSVDDATKYHNEWKDVVVIPSFILRTA